MRSTMSNLEITIYGGIIVAIVTIFILTPLKNQIIRFFQRQRIPGNPTAIKTTKPRKTASKSGIEIYTEKPSAFSFHEARKIAKEKSDASLSLWRSEISAKIEASLLADAKRLLESGKVRTFEEGKKLAKELSDAELEFFRHETSARIEKDLLESAKNIIESGIASTFYEAKRMAQEKSDAELEVWRAEIQTRLEKELLEQTKKILKNTQ